MRPICSIDGCDRAINSKRLGLCSMHQRRLERHGNIDITLTPNTRPRGQQDFIKIDDNTASIPLTKGYEAIVDLEDVTRLIKHTWYLHRDASNRVSARAKINGRAIYMHNFLVPQIEGLITDHINRDPLDNRKKNLRRVTNSENAQNTLRVDNAIGMTFNKKEQRWKAYVSISGQRKHLGTFKTQEEAEDALNAARNQ